MSDELEVLRAVSADSPVLGELFGDLDCLRDDLEHAHTTVNDLTDANHMLLERVSALESEVADLVKQVEHLESSHDWVRQDMLEHRDRADGLEAAFHKLTERDTITYAADVLAVRNGKPLEEWSAKTQATFRADVLAIIKAAIEATS